MRESAIEKYLVGRVKAIGGLCYKWSSPSNRGVPDRIIILYDKVYFIEMKSNTGKLSKLQKIVIDKIQNALDRNLGAYVLVIHSKGEVDEFLERCEKEKEI